MSSSTHKLLFGDRLPAAETAHRQGAWPCLNADPLNMDISLAMHGFILTLTAEQGPTPGAWHGEHAC